MSIHRQLRDIILQGERFKNIDYITEQSVAEFNQYALEIKSYLSKYTSNELITERLVKINPLSYSKTQLPFWFFLTVVLLPYYLHIALREYNKKIACQERLLEIVSIFASIEFLLKND